MYGLSIYFFTGVVYRIYEYKLTNLFKENQLHIAAECGDLDLFQSLLGQENIAITRNDRGCNPLDIALEKDQTQIAEYISRHQR